MKQVATFLVPEQQAEANEFLRTHKPEEQFFSKDTIIFFYDTGEVSPAYEIADLQELLRSNKNARFQQEVTRFVLQRQLADLQAERSTLNTKANKTRVEEVDNMISNIKQAISQADQAILMQDIKAEFAEGRIVELKG
jgi:transcription elongation factor GreA-like protein